MSQRAIFRILVTQSSRAVRIRGRVASAHEAAAAGNAERAESQDAPMRAYALASPAQHALGHIEGQKLCHTPSVPAPRARTTSTRGFCSTCTSFPLVCVISSASSPPRRRRLPPLCAGPPTHACRHPLSAPPRLLVAGDIRDAALLDATSPQTLLMSPPDTFDAVFLTTVPYRLLHRRAPPLAHACRPEVRRSSLHVDLLSNSPLSGGPLMTAATEEEDDDDNEMKCLGRDMTSGARRDVGEMVGTRPRAATSWDLRDELGPSRRAASDEPR
ncbi:uncharacterized protein SCHCODRAFT_02707115 [Schizophyllum commune H4-8]|uniref:uncharacterized protein n=1 Tax=Schizophyllum commune (strain H4-8 / FGSC 9210) TaxID=578458 RepID=UPI00215F0924|nr:uncharacterized protein SCHCODRAFT_02707115 [Schizophyllum commune H4-8]KAI5885207.1 hypothetical protein SCHCODRAFT_02707115 [Schizophyllum commune H4-8]